MDTEDGLPVGVVRFDNAGDGWEIGIAIDAAARGRRLGAHVLEAAMCRRLGPARRPPLRRPRVLPPRGLRALGQDAVVPGTADRPGDGRGRPMLT